MSHRVAYPLMRLNQPFTTIVTIYDSSSFDTGDTVNGPDVSQSFILIRKVGAVSPDSALLWIHRTATEESCGGFNAVAVALLHRSDMGPHVLTPRLDSVEDLAARNKMTEGIFVPA